MRLSKLTICTGLLFLPSGQILAADLDVEAPIGAVTVFLDRAEVTRVVTVPVPAGATTLVIDGLPASLLPDSVRASGLSDGAVAIGSVEVKSIFSDAAASAQERRLGGELEALQDQRRAIEDRIAAFRVQLDFIAAIGRDMPQTANAELVRGSMDPEKWRQAWTALGSGAAEAHAAIRLAEVERRAVDARIAQKSQELAQVQTGRSATVVARVNVEAEIGAQLTLSLSYQLGDAWWQPLYDARLETETGRLELVQIGQVRQRTGEDWSKVALTLSTAQPAAGAYLPELHSWFVGLTPARGPVESRIDEIDDSGLRQREELKTLLDGSLGTVAGGVPQSVAKSKTAELMATEFAAEYKIPGSASIPSDDAPHKLVIAEHDLTSKLAVRAVPKLAPAAHLFASFAHGGEEPLLPGQVSIFRDGAFVGTSAIGMLRPRETVVLGFGVDDKVRVDYRFETGAESAEGLFGGDRRVERRYRIEIANYHAKPIEITVLDQLPVSQDERVEVELLSGSTRPSKTDW